MITDFEMLFDPRYKIDVIKLFCEKARLINVAVKWPGTFTGSKLIYTKHEYLALKMQACYEPSELASVPQMFPFEYEVETEIIFGSNDFELRSFYGSPVVVG